jgi:hypothetical protein
VCSIALNNPDISAIYDIGGDTQPMSNAAIAAFLRLMARQSPMTGTVTVVSDFSWMTKVRSRTYTLAAFRKALKDEGCDLNKDRLILAPIAVGAQPQ